jgi:inositol phosphorylceramide mannosyltransferase catalytic subunit
LGSVIPRRIIQTGKSHDLPLFSRASAVNIRLLNPDYEYIFFDDNHVETFIDRHFPQYRAVFDAFRVPIQRYDFFRYLAIYHFGGFYFDLDVFLAFDISPLLQLGCVFPFEELTMNRTLRRRYGMDWEIGNYAFGANAGHPFLKAIIENCIRGQIDTPWLYEMLKPIPRIFREEFYVLNSTGPGAISRTLAEYTDAASCVNVLFPDNVCDSSNWHRFGSYGVHLQNASWRKRKSFIWRRLALEWENRIRKRMLKESLALGPSRSLNGDMYPARPKGQ